MSVYINMEMPKSCGKCPCFHAENPMYCQAVKADKNKKIIAPYGKPRPEWCPLVAVPPHGRLGDLDAAVELAMQYCPDDDGSCPEAGSDLRELLDEIESLPTIIPADEMI